MDSATPTLPLKLSESESRGAEGSPVLSERAHLTLPDHPLVSIRARGSHELLPWKDLWVYRELLMFLVWRDLKVRYKQTFLGVAWALLQPLAATLIITFFFGRFGGFAKNATIPYPLYVYCGMLPWTFFSNAVTNSSNSLTNNTNLITKVYFPRILIPLAPIGAGLLDLAIGTVVLLGMAIHYGVHLGPALLLLPVLWLLSGLLAFAVGVFMSSVAVRYRDARYMLPFIIQLWMFASPIIYQRNLVPARWQWLLEINPITGIIGTFRAVAGGAPLDLGSLVGCAAITLELLLVALWTFRRMERVFADVI